MLEMTVTLSMLMLVAIVVLVLEFAQLALLTKPNTDAYQKRERLTLPLFMLTAEGICITIKLIIIIKNELMRVSIEFYINYSFTNYCCVFYLYFLSQYLLYDELVLTRR